MRGLGSIGIALLGLLIVATSPLVIAANSWVFSTDPGFPDYGIMVAVVGAGVVYAGIGAAFVIKRRAIASRLFPDEAVGVGASGPAMLRAALIVIGIVLVLSGFASLIDSVSSALTNASLSANVEVIVDYIVPNSVIALRAAAGVAKLVIGLLLVLRPQRIGEVLWDGASASERECA